MVNIQKNTTHFIPFEKYIRPRYFSSLHHVVRGIRCVFLQHNVATCGYHPRSIPEKLHLDYLIETGAIIWLKQSKR